MATCCATYRDIHHNPFDRLLIVQALDEGLTILTSDRAFEPYRVPVAWA